MCTSVIIIFSILFDIVYTVNRKSTQYPPGNEQQSTYAAL